jgi:acyl-coenzyme A thioesterase PaaI-like protein
MSEVTIADRADVVAGTPQPVAAGQPPDRTIEVEDHNCFACGSLNAHGLRLDLHVQAGRCWTALALDTRFEGWEGIAHGGILTTILDEVMAWSLVDHDTWGFTARLAVDFKRPVRVGQPIRAEGWVGDAHRRLIRTAGRILDPASGTVLATAEATYVPAPEDRKRALQARYRLRLVADEPGVADHDRAGSDPGRGAAR